MGIDSARPLIAVRDLDPIHDPETAGRRPDLERLSDAELVASVVSPSNGDRLRIRSGTGRVIDGNGRAYELRRRAADPSSRITWEMEVPYELYTPWTFE